MTTLTLKKNNTEELLKTIQSQNEWIIKLLEENNKLLLQSNKKNDRPKQSRNDIVDKIFSEFAPGNNHTTMMKLIKFVGKWGKSDIDNIRERLISHGVDMRHIKSFDRMLKKDK